MQKCGSFTSNVLKYASERLKNNGEGFIVEAVKISPSALNYAYRFLTFDEDEEKEYDVDFSLDAEKSEDDRKFMLQVVESKWAYRTPQYRQFKSESKKIHKKTVKAKD